MGGKSKEEAMGDFIASVPWEFFYKIPVSHFLRDIKI